MVKIQHHGHPRYRLGPHADMLTTYLDAYIFSNNVNSSYSILLTCLVPGTMVENSRLPCVRVRLLQHHTSLIPCQSVEIIIIDKTRFLDISFDI